MKWVVEFSTHDGRRLRTSAFRDEDGARIARLMMRMMSRDFGYDMNPEILTIVEESDLVGYEKN